MGAGKKLVCNTVVTLIIIILFAGGILENPESLLIDLSYRLGAEKISPETSPVILITIGEPSLDYIGEWPWNRDIYARGIEKVFQAGAKCVGLDVLLLEEREGDTELQKAMEMGPVFIPEALEISITRRFFSEIPKVESRKTPIPSLKAVAAGTGHVNYIADRDGIIRRFTSIPEIPAWSKKIAEKYLGRDIEQVTDKEIYINFSPPDNSFPHLSYKDLLQGNYDPRKFKDRVVLIGSTAVTLGDFLMTPFAHRGFTPGVVVGANAVKTLINQEEIVRLSPALVIILLLILASLNLLLLPRLGYRETFLALLILSLLILSAGQILFYREIILDRIPLLLTLYLQGSIQLYDLFRHGELKHRKIRKHFQRYLPRELVEEIASFPEKVNLKGEKREILALFIDLRGFSEWAEKHSPEETVSFLNKFFSIVTNEVMKKKGTLDKFLGDGVLIIFGAPLTSPQPLEKALDILFSVNTELHKDHFPLSIGAGLEVGEVIAGNIGSEKRLEYTVIGPPVNTASHLEARARPGEVILGPRATRIYSSYRKIKPTSGHLNLKISRLKE